VRILSKSDVFVDHVALFVQDIQWYISFFEEVFGMEIKRFEGTLPSPEKLWFSNGIQLISTDECTEPSGNLAHIGIFVSDIDAVLEKAYQRGAVALPKGRHWLKLMDGLCLEIMPIK
jgi:predicted enzyme related to lactoylglutathione lyase